jgi:beta-ketodecanoyl-[acyl-carrier-protein] synthase
MHSVVISGTGIYQPPYTITNAELVEAFNRYVDQENARLADEIAAGVREPLTYSSVEFIEKASGIKQRYVLEKSGVLDPSRMYPRFTERPDDQLSLMAEIAVDAARKALDAAGKTGDQIDAVLCSAANMQRAYPAMAIEIQQALGAGGYGFDMNVACSSATFAIEQAVNAVRTGSAKCVLVVNPEITSGHQAWNDRDCHFIFGDVCTAVIVERADCATGRPVGSAGHQAGHPVLQQHPQQLRLSQPLRGQRPERARQDLPPGRPQGVQGSGAAGCRPHRGHLAALEQAPTAVRRYWLHQANQGMNQLVIKKLVGADAGADVAPLILDEFANTASAGSIIAFHKHRADLAAGDVGVICSFGAGYSVGSVVVRKR